MSKLLIITGAPATGKTSLLADIARETRTAFFSKDELKEITFDVVAGHDLALSKKLGVASFKILFKIVERFAEAGQNLIIEANFRPSYDEAELARIVRIYDIQLLQILCVADVDVLLERIVARKTSGQRHEGHFDIGRDDEIREAIENDEYRFFSIPGSKNIKVDTSEFSDKTFGSAIESARDFLL